MLPEQAEGRDAEGKRAKHWRWVAPAVLTFLVVGFYWKLVFSNEYTWLQSPDLANQVLPWYQMQASEWHNGHFPLWDPYHWLGQPLFGQLLPGSAFPPNWLLFNLPLKNGWIQQANLHWYFVLQHLAAALFAYLFVRDLGRSRVAAVLSGCVYSLSAWMGSTDWPQMLNGAIWAPLIFLFLMRIVRGHKPVVSSAWGGFFLGFALLSGHHQVPIYMSLACAGIWLYVLLKTPEKQQLRRIALLCLLFWGVAFMAGGLQILPAHEYGKLSVRWIGYDDPVGWNDRVPYEIHKRYSLSPVSLVGIVFAGMYTNSDPFLGVAVLMLCVVAVTGGWRIREVRIFFLVGLGSLLFSFAQHNMFHGLIYSLLPIVEKARSPSMAVVLFGFSASVLAAFGLDLAREAEQRKMCRILGLIALGFGVIIFVIRGSVALARGFEVSGDDRPMMTLAASLLTGGLLLAYSRGAISHRAASILLIGTFMVEVTNTNGFFMQSRFEKDRPQYLAGMGRDADLVEYLRRQPGPIRVDVNNQEVQHNFGDWHGIDTLGGFLASLTANFRPQQPYAPRSKQLFGVGYALRKEPDDFYKELALVGRSGEKIFVNRSVFPRAFAVHDVISLPSYGQVGPYLHDPAFDLRKKSFVVGEAPSLETCPAEDHVQISEYIPNRVRIRAILGCRGMVVLSDTYFPGWRATVDGKPARIFEAYGVIRGIVVDAGSHEIEMRYLPGSVIVGAVLSATALLLCAGLTLASWRPAVTVPA